MALLEKIKNNLTTGNKLGSPISIKAVFKPVASQSAI